MAASRISSLTKKTRFSIWIRHNNVLTLDQLMKGFESCYKPNPTAIKPHEVYSFGEWLEIGSISKHSKPHVFRITRHEQTGKAQVHYKKWTTDKEWISTVGLPLVQEDVIRKEMKLKTVRTNVDGLNLEKLTTDLQTVFRYFRNQDLRQWWADFVNELMNSEDSSGDGESDALERLKEKAEDRGRTDNNSEPEFTDVLDLEAPLPPVIIKAKPKKRKESSPTVGQFVLTFLDKYCEKFPQLGKVIDVKQDSVLVQWFEGAKSTVWHPKTLPDKEMKRRPFTEWIPVSEIFHHSFTLTASNALPKAAKSACDKFMENL